jgi:hypothetical protein
MRWWSFERRWLACLWASILPSGTPGGLTLGAPDVPLDRFLDELTLHAPRRVAWGARLAVWLLTLSPLFILGRAALFPSLDEEERLALLERLARSDVYLVRELPTLFKMLGALGFAGLPRVHEALGMPDQGTRPPPWLGEAEP